MQYALSLLCLPEQWVHAMGVVFVASWNRKFDE
jgi:hypothetical protein